MEQEIWCKNGNSTITWKSDIHGELVVPILVPLLVGHLNVVLKLLLLFPQVWCHPWNRKTLFPSLIMFFMWNDSVMLWIQFVHLEKSEVGDSEVILNTSKTHQSCIFTSATTGYISTAITLLHYIPGKSLQRLSSILSSLLRNLEPYISVMRPKNVSQLNAKTWNAGQVCWGRSWQWRVPHIHLKLERDIRTCGSVLSGILETGTDQKCPLVNDFCASRRRPKDCSPRGGGVVCARSLLLAILWSRRSFGSQLSTGVLCGC